MTTKRARTATAMSWFLALAPISACMRIETSGPDGTGGGHPLPDAYIPGTSLAGSIGCGSLTCGPQSVCTQQFSGFDAGVPDDAGIPADRSYACAAVPASCRIYDCYGESCSQCIRDLCYSGSYGYGMSVSGRYVTCPGP